uniref:Uncharacterized protein n=1 Tax=Cacopsylla melanoneura TaxID=428564 RepID=A0A8D8R046_9HEMI
MLMIWGTGEGLSTLSIPSPRGEPPVRMAVKIFSPTLRRLAQGEAGCSVSITSDLLGPTCVVAVGLKIIVINMVRMLLQEKPPLGIKLSEIWLVLTSSKSFRSSRGTFFTLFGFSANFRS